MTADVHNIWKDALQHTHQHDHLDSLKRHENERHSSIQLSMHAVQVYGTPSWVIQVKSLVDIQSGSGIRGYVPYSRGGSDTRGSKLFVTDSNRNLLIPT